MTLDAQHLKHILTDAFAPTHLSIRDDSAKHVGHAGNSAGGGHYHVILVTGALAGLGRLARHQAVMQVLQDEFAHAAIHALSLRIFTPEEWHCAAFAHTLTHTPSAP